MSTLEVKQATYVRAAHPTEIYYLTAKTELRVESGQAYTYLTWALPSALIGATVVTAVVEMTAQNDTWTATNTLQRMANPGAITISRMKYSNRPGVLAGSVGVPGTKSGATWSWNVQPDLQAFADGGQFYGFRLSTTSTTRRVFLGPDVSDGAPILRLEYVLPGGPPAGVTPSGGVVSIPAPPIVWRAADDTTAVQVQVAPNEAAWDEDTGFTTPTFDTGTVATSLGRVDLAAAGWAGAAPDVLIDTSTRELGPLGWSEWSQPTTWSYDPRPAVALTEPPTSTSGDPTPPHEWTVSTDFMGWQLLIEDVATGAIIYNSGFEPGMDTTATPTKGPTREGQLVRSRLRIFDRADRLATTGQEVFTEVTREWSLELDLAIAPATSFVVEQIGNTPQTRAKFQRATGAPDEWVVTRAGDIIARFDFDENQITSGSWSLDDWGCPPNQDVTYEVIPMVDGVAGKPKQVTVHTQVAGFWVVDPISGDWITLDGDDIQSLALGESSVVYTPLNGDRVIIRTLGLRGLEGSVSLSLRRYRDRSAFDQATTAKALRRVAPRRSLRLIYGSTNVPVAMRVFSVVDDEHTATFRDLNARVTFECYQSGELPEDDYSAAAS